LKTQLKARHQIPTYPSGLKMILIYSPANLILPSFFDLTTSRAA